MALLAAYAPCPGTALTLTNDDTKQTRPSPRSIISGRNLSEVGGVAVGWGGVGVGVSVWSGVGWG